MKKFKMQVFITYLVAFVIAVIINGIYSLINMGLTFINMNVIVEALIFSSTYLLFVWMETRKNKLITYLGVLSLMLVIVFIPTSNDYKLFESWNWFSTVSVVYCLVFSQIATLQVNKLE